MSTESVVQAEAPLAPVSKQDSVRAIHGLEAPRVLIIDDTRSIHDAFRKILTSAPRPALEDLEAELFDFAVASGPRAQFQLDSAYQGPEGLELVQRWRKAGLRYALAFVDGRRPPGWDGIETVAHLWAEDPDIQVVLCTAYADYPWDELVRRLGQTDNLLLLKKPFAPAEVVQIAHALTRKWVLLQQAKGRLEDLDHTIARRTHELNEANEQLRHQIIQRQASEANHRALVEQMPDAILVHVDQRFVYANPAALRLVGAQQADQLVGRPVWDLVPPELRELVKSRIENSARGYANQSIEQQIVRLDGTRLAIEVSSLPFTYQGQAAVQTVMRDITARQKTAEALRVSEERFRSVWERSLDGMRLTDREGRILGVNEAFCKLVKLPREKLLGQVFSVAYKGHGPDDGLDVYQQRFETGTILPRITARVQFWNSEEAELEISSSFIELGQQGKMALAIFRDVTERKQLEQQLRQSQKMEAIGQLAGGVAHDFNNLLAVIRGNTELVLMKEEQLPEPVGECLKQVVAAADRAAGLTRQLLAFSRKQVMQAQPLNLNEVIGNFTKMLKRIIGEDIQLQCNYAARLPLVQADAAMLEQVLVNLVVNARDAMPRGGQLVVATEPVTVDAASLKQHGEARLGDFVALSVSDTGAGIPPEHLPHIFEPFFTTKEVGKGTGLGLATVYGIAKQHGGWVEAASTPGAGATFKLFLPALAAAAPAPATPALQPNPAGGTETILLVEDDEAVRSLTRRLLESFGYHVHEAASGLEALEVWRAQAERIDLLLTDMVMPEGLNGRELAEHLLAQRSHLRIIFMTGYSPNVAGKDTQCFRRSGSALLQKPCHWRELLLTIRRLLDTA